MSYGPFFSAIVRVKRQTLVFEMHGKSTPRRRRPGGTESLIVEFTDDEGKILGFLAAGSPRTSRKKGDELKPAL